MWDVDDARFGKAVNTRSSDHRAHRQYAFLADAATAWTRILFDLTKQRETVQQAVDDVNAIDSVQQFAVYGNSGIKF